MPGERAAVPIVMCTQVEMNSDVGVQKAAVPGAAVEAETLSLLQHLDYLLFIWEIP